MKIVTVNCARIIHGNQVATNGVVHIIDRVITAVGNTIQDVIEVDDDLTTLSVSLLFSLCPFLPFLSYLSFPTFFIYIFSPLFSFSLLISSFSFYFIRFINSYSINGAYDGGYDVFSPYRKWLWPQACWTSWDSQASTPCLPPPTMPSPSWTQMCCND